MCVGAHVSWLGYVCMWMCVSTRVSCLRYVHVMCIGWYTCVMAWMCVYVGVCWCTVSCLHVCASGRVLATCGCWCMWMCVSTCVMLGCGAQRPLPETSSFLLLCDFWGLNSGHYVWQQVPLLPKLFCTPSPDTGTHIAWPQTVI